MKRAWFVLMLFTASWAGASDVQVTPPTLEPNLANLWNGQWRDQALLELGGVEMVTPMALEERFKQCLSEHREAFLQLGSGKRRQVILLMGLAIPEPLDFSPDAPPEWRALVERLSERVVESYERAHEQAASSKAYAQRLLKDIDCGPRGEDALDATLLFELVIYVYMVEQLTGEGAQARIKELSLLRRDQFLGYVRQVRRPEQRLIESIWRDWAQYGATAYPLRDMPEAELAPPYQALLGWYADEFLVDMAERVAAESQVEDALANRPDLSESVLVALDLASDRLRYQEALAQWANKHEALLTRMNLEIGPGDSVARSLGVDPQTYGLIVQPANPEDGLRRRMLLRDFQKTYSEISAARNDELASVRDRMSPGERAVLNRELAVYRAPSW